MKTNIFLKKLNIFILVILSGFMLTGCKNSFDHMPDLTDEERKIIAQYAADIMIKHDKNNGKLVTDYEIQLYDEREAQKQENLAALLAMKQAESVEDASGKSSSSAGDGVDDGASQVKVFTPVEQVLGIDGFTISYGGFFVTDSYSDGSSDNNFFALDATPGNKLLAVEFDVVNNSSSDQELDIFDINVKFKVGFDDEYPRLVMSTMLLNDMSMYRNIIPANGVDTMVLLREIPESQASQIQNISVEAVRDGITYYIQ